MNLRDYERESIRRFVKAAADDGHLAGIVLDYGCGLMPYRQIVESHRLGVQYQPFDQVRFPGNVSGEDLGQGDPLVMRGWTAILCTQVVQYVPAVGDLLRRFRHALDSGGTLVLTYPTNWPVVEEGDLHRFTKAGMERLLTEAGFTIVRHEQRGSVHDPQFHTASGKRIRATGEEFVLGYGVVARA